MGTVSDDRAPGDPPYVAALGLRAAPFAADGGTAPYRDSTILQRLNLLRHLIQSTDRLVVVQAPAGGGKTTALAQLRALADESWRVAVVPGDGLGDSAALYRTLSAALAEPTPPAAEDAAIRAALARLRADALLPVLLVDDAHRLPAPVLEALLSLAYPPSPASARIVLFAEPSLHALLDQTDPPSGARRSLHVEMLAPLTPEQTEAYLMHRLLAAGLSGSGPFGPRQIKKIHRAAHGLPGAINEQAHRLLLDGAGRKRRDGRPLALRLLPGLGLFALAALTAVALVGVQGPLGRWLASPARAPARATTPAPLRREPALAAGHVTAAADVAATQSAAPAAHARGTQAPTASGSRAGAAAPRPASAPVSPAPAPGPARAMAAAASPPGGVPAAAPTPAASNPVRPSPVRRPPVSGSGAQRATVAAMVAVDDEHSPPPVRATPGVASHPPAHATHRAAPPPPAHAGPTPAQAPTPSHSGASATARGAARAVQPSGPGHGAAWLLRQDPRHYTVQVIAVRRLRTLSHLVAARHDKVPVAWFPVRRRSDSEVLYALVYGIYPSRAAAEHAAAALPRVWHAAHPWVRTLASVQSAIRRAAAP